MKNIYDLYEGVFDDDEAVETRYDDPAFSVHDEKSWRDWLKRHDVEWSKKELDNMLKAINDQAEKLDRGTSTVTIYDYTPIPQYIIVNNSSEKVFNYYINFNKKYRKTGSNFFNVGPGFMINLLYVSSDSIDGRTKKRIGEYITVCTKPGWIDLPKISSAYNKWLKKIDKMLHDMGYTHIDDDKDAGGYIKKYSKE